MLPTPPPLPPSLAAHIDSPAEMLRGSLCLGFVAFVAVFILGELVGRVSKPLGALIVMASFPVGLLICAATYWLSVTA